MNNLQAKLQKTVHDTFGEEKEPNDVTIKVLKGAATDEIIGKEVDFTVDGEHYKAVFDVEEELDSEIIKEVLDENLTTEDATIEEVEGDMSKEKDEEVLKTEDALLEKVAGCVNKGVEEMKAYIDEKLKGMVAEGDYHKESEEEGADVEGDEEQTTLTLPEDIAEKIRNGEGEVSDQPFGDLLEGDKEEGDEDLAKEIDEELDPMDDESIIEEITKSVDGKLSLRELYPSKFTN